MTDIVERLGYLNDALLACGSDYSDILLNTVNELRQIRQQLGECQKESQQWFVRMQQENDSAIALEEELAELKAEMKLDAEGPDWIQRAMQAEAALQIRDEQLAECQAREKVLREEELK
jgi:hypothetical protein